MTKTEQPLARFLDRNTMVYDRRYEHPIERVWTAVTTAEHLDAWMLPETRIDAQLGGVCGFGWGGEIDETNLDTITVWEPPTCVQYTAVDGSFMRFDLERDGDATRLQFTLHYLPPTDDAMDAHPGGDRPGGPDTAWRPGFLVGFHEMLDVLGPYLSGEWTRADNQAWLDRFVENGPTPESLDLQARYRQHVIDTIPPAAP